MAITYIASTSRPDDNNTQAGNVSSSLLISAAGAITGDLVVVIAQYRGNVTLQVGSETGGMTWNSLTQFNDANSLCAVRIFWCRWNTAVYNGNNPNFDAVSGSSTVPFSTVAHIFRPTNSSNQWAIDTAQATTQYAAPSTPFTVTRNGITTTNANTVSIANWLSEDRNTWDTLTGTGWSVLGNAQYRNTTGSRMSSTYAYQIKTSAGATNNASKNQATFGGDAGVTAIVAWYEFSSGAIAGSSSFAITGSGTSRGKTSLTGSSSASFTGSSIIRGKAPIVGSTSFSVSSSATLAAVNRIVGNSSFAFTTSGAAKGKGNIIGASAIALTASGTVAGRTNITGSVGFALSQTGVIRGRGSQIGTANILISTSSTIKGKGIIVGSAPITIISTAVIRGRTSMSGASSALWTSFSILTGKGSVSGQSAISLSLIGSLSEHGNYSGTASFSLIASGNLTAKSSIIGAIQSSFSANGLLKGSTSLTGSCTFSILVAGQVIGHGSLAGNAQVSTILNAAIQAIGHLAGSANYAFISSGTITGIGDTNVQPIINVTYNTRFTKGIEKDTSIKKDLTYSLLVTKESNLAAELSTTKTYSVKLHKATDHDIH